MNGCGARTDQILPPDPPTFANPQSSPGHGTARTARIDFRGTLPNPLRIGRWVQCVCNSMTATVRPEYPDPLREMSTATEPAPAVVHFLKQRKRLPIDGDRVEVRRGLRVEVCASALGETIDREVAGRGQDVKLGVALEIRLRRTGRLVPCTAVGSGVGGAD